MNFLIYLIIFIMGTFFGSFFTLAVYRIPLGQDILYTHSYCPKCNHKLAVLDLFPIISYISLKGKCRYCGEPVRIRYLLLEILSGIVFLLYAISFKLDFIFYDISKLIHLSFGLLYFASLFIIAGIDKENIKIEKSLLIYGFILSIGYIIYACTTNSSIVYAYGMYLFVMLVLMLYKFTSNNYILQIFALSTYMLIFSNILGIICTLIFNIFIIVVYYVVKKENDKIPIGFCLCISNIIVNIILNFIQYYFI